MFCKLSSNPLTACVADYDPSYPVGSRTFTSMPLSPPQSPKSSSPAMPKPRSALSPTSSDPALPNHIPHNKAIFSFAHILAYPALARWGAIRPSHVKITHTGIFYVRTSFKNDLRETLLIPILGSTQTTAYPRIASSLQPTSLQPTFASIRR
jgi:hypothetical protein